MRFREGDPRDLDRARAAVAAWRERNPDQVFRLARFRQDHPGVVIGDAGFGAWEARIPEPAGETVTVRHTLHELLDRLDELTAQPGGMDGG